MRQPLCRSLEQSLRRPGSRSQAVGPLADGQEPGKTRSVRRSIRHIEKGRLKLDVSLEEMPAMQSFKAIVDAMRMRQAPSSDSD